MALIDTDKIAQQFGSAAADLVVKIANEGTDFTNKLMDKLETKDLVITTTVRLQDRV